MTDAVTFNVVYTPGTVRLLLPMGLTLLRGSGVRLRLAANGCDASERELLRAAAARDGRLSFYELPFGGPMVSHGLALNHLFEIFPEEGLFAIADSDVIATGDFMPALLPLSPGAVGVSTGSAAGVAKADEKAAPGARILSGRTRILAGGEEVGTTYFSIFDRAGIEAAWRRAPRGFEQYAVVGLPRAVRRDLGGLIAGVAVLDTCKLVSLLLVADGRRLEYRQVSELHHAGGVSVARVWASRGLLETVRSMLSSKAHRRPRPLAAYVVLRIVARRSKRDPRQQATGRRARAVNRHMGAVLEALVAGAPPPPAPDTGSAEVDAKVAAVTEALREHYRPL